MPTTALAKGSEKPQREQPQQRGTPPEVLTVFAVEGAGVAARILRARVALGARLTAAASAFPVHRGALAQQTVGNVLAGVVLLSARPFQIGDRVRFNGYGMDVEGTVAAHGLLYLTLTDGADLVQMPNSTALAMSNRPMREPAAVDMRARLPADLDPEEIQKRLTEAITVRTKGPPHVALEELDPDGVVVRIRAKPPTTARAAASRARF